jgi:hypothetical protein
VTEEVENNSREAGAEAAAEPQHLTLHREEEVCGNGVGVGAAVSGDKTNKCTMNNAALLPQQTPVMALSSEDTAL